MVIRVCAAVLVLRHLRARLGEEENSSPGRATDANDGENGTCRSPRGCAVQGPDDPAPREPRRQQAPACRQRVQRGVPTGSAVFRRESSPGGIGGCCNPGDAGCRSTRCSENGGDAAATGERRCAAKQRHSPPGRDAADATVRGVPTGFCRSTPRVYIVAFCQRSRGPRVLDQGRFEHLHPSRRHPGRRARGHEHFPGATLAPTGVTAVKRFGHPPASP
mmetsp:Transcript_84102/g.224820  ORF Transcript_84102/g.224820 Transcript_84102/m.224820 type:complete len:219 (+) Transcript_84102:693-1349(+)